MHGASLESIARLAQNGVGQPACLEIPGPLRPSGVEILHVQEADEVWKVATPHRVRLWWKRVVLPPWRRPFNLLARSRSRREACGLLMLCQRGLPAPRVCACIEWRRHGLLYESALVTYDIGDALTFEEFLRGEKSAERHAVACAAVGRLVGQVHRAGIGHFRLFAKNILVHREDPRRVWLLDAPYVCAWDSPTPPAICRYDLAALCSRVGGLDLVDAGMVLQEYFLATGWHWDGRRIAGAPRWRLKLRRISLYLASIWSGHHAVALVRMPKGLA